VDNAAIRPSPDTPRSHPPPCRAGTEGQAAEELGLRLAHEDQGHQTRSHHRLGRLLRRLGCRERCFLERYCLTFLSLNVCWAQSKADEPAFPFTKRIFRWDYSCPGVSAFGCSFTCPGQAGVGHLIKLRLYLRIISLDGSQTAPALFYEYSTKEFPQASRFTIGSGLSNLSCHVSGMALDYSGPPK